MSSSTRIVSRKAELQVLRGMTHPNKAIAGTLFATTDDRYFHGDISKESYYCILKHYVESGEAPALRIILQDPDLSKEAKQYLKLSENSIDSVKSAEKAAKILNTYRQRRELVEISQIISQGLSSKKKTEQLIEEVSSQISKVHINKSIENAFVHFGKNSNSKQRIKDLLFGEDNDTVIPTGIEEFDKQSGGFVRGNLVTLASSSGGGKSLIANQLGLNIAEAGYKVLIVPLEMSHKEMEARVVANIAGYDNTQILHKQLSSNDREIAYKKYARWSKLVQRNGGRYTIFKPNSSMTMEEIVAATSSYHCDVVIIDYVSLLRMPGRKEQWQALSEISKYAKNNAEAMNRVNILLCQAGKEGDIRYARAITEDSNVSWVWLTSQQEREKPIGTIVVNQPKSRSSKAFPMRLGINWSTMKVVKAPDVIENEDIPKSLQKPKRSLNNLD